MWEVAEILRQREEIRKEKITFQKTKEKKKRKKRRNVK